MSAPQPQTKLKESEYFVYHFRVRRKTDYNKSYQDIEISLKEPDMEFAQKQAEYIANLLYRGYVELKFLFKT